MGHRRPNIIFARDVYQRNGMRGGFDVRNVQLAEFFDVAEDVLELFAKFPFLFPCQLNAGEVGYVFDVKVTWRR